MVEGLTFMILGCIFQESAKGAIAEHIRFMCSEEGPDTQ